MLSFSLKLKYLFHRFNSEQFKGIAVIDSDCIVDNCNVTDKCIYVQKDFPNSEDCTKGF